MPVRFCQCPTTYGHLCGKPAVGKFRYKQGTKIGAWKNTCQSHIDRMIARLPAGQTVQYKQFNDEGSHDGDCQSAVVDRASGEAQK